MGAGNESHETMASITGRENDGTPNDFKSSKPMVCRLLRIAQLRYVNVNDSIRILDNSRRELGAAAFSESLADSGLRHADALGKAGL
jgi:hypothetical protein